MFIKLIGWCRENCIVNYIVGRILIYFLLSMLFSVIAISMVQLFSLTQSPEVFTQSIANINENLTKSNLFMSFSMLIGMALFVADIVHLFVRALRKPTKQEAIVNLRVIIKRSQKKRVKNNIP